MSNCVIYTNEKNCKGCNKCIFVCPTRANEALFEAEEGKVIVKKNRCISCGECIDICDHEGRNYSDNTEQFFEDIEKREPPIVIIAPAAQFNFTNTRKLIGCLKDMGVKHVYDVSFGADICTWAHIKAIKENGTQNIISQPCPVVVKYIEKYHPDIIERLSPVHSPAICLAVYLKKHLNFKDKIAFLSPCIGKTQECIDPNTQSAINYNLTFSKFVETLNERNIVIENSQPRDFDNVAGSIGFVFSRPGGLAENISYYCGDSMWIKQIEGMKNIHEYIAQYKQDLQSSRPVPDVVDMLNCKHGCNLGTGTYKNASPNQIDYITNLRKKEVIRSSSDELLASFDSNFELSDFTRNYTDASNEIVDVSDVIDIESAFVQLGKYSDDDRSLNCFSCGYGSCLEFAKELAAGHNDKSNCKDYLLRKFKRLSHYDELTGVYNRYAHSERLKHIKENHPGFLGVMFIDINGLKEANDIHGHKHGDFLIVSCVKIIRKVFPNDVYRIGGDEFFAFDSSSNENTFAKKTKELIKYFNEQDIVAVSVGTSHSYSKDDIEQSISEADKQMYENKQNYYTNIKRADRRKS